MQLGIAFGYGTDPSQAINAKVNSMTYHSTSEPFPARGNGILATTLAGVRKAYLALGSLLSAVGEALVKAGEASSRANDIAMLQAKSDEELAKMGIQRDQIAQYVFRDLFYS